MNISRSLPYITYVIPGELMNSSLSAVEEEENNQAEKEEEAAIDAKVVERLKSWCYL